MDSFNITSSFTQLKNQSSVSISQDNILTFCFILLGLSCQLCMTFWQKIRRLEEEIQSLRKEMHQSESLQEESRNLKREFRSLRDEVRQYQEDDREDKLCLVQSMQGIVQDLGRMDPLEIFTAELKEELEKMADVEDKDFAPVTEEYVEAIVSPKRGGQMIEQDDHDLGEKAWEEDHRELRRLMGFEEGQEIDDDSDSTIKVLEEYFEDDRDEKSSEFEDGDGPHELYGCEVSHQELPIRRRPVMLRN